jgi:hypothetical protein
VYDIDISQFRRPEMKQTVFAMWNAFPNATTLVAVLQLVLVIGALVAGTEPGLNGFIGGGCPSG